ncbi:hypothetical protein EA462_10775 [Natrarchaeobius halalkaliphilus]|uniref:Uncharacterized protein n=1 Tax=Natrarchaeobius halalkaliphilus TaxID=1679091 RepID=A0A3N6LJJ1_9EURY|nr:hypothetical protein [Natrarchaeobius halalkaliphilus]RQG88873.1 hypothetical protein EA462_10775 [Natrarchaeobius halalkaliphilus]
MGLPGTIDSSVYEGLKDVLQRYPVITAVAYEPDRIVKQFLRARVDPSRLVPPSGPEPPTLDIEWRFLENESYYRIHYADSNAGFNCGWHRDDDHPELGPVHFQFDHPVTGEREPVHFEQCVPTEILWTVLDRLFEERIPSLTSTV